MPDDEHVVARTAAAILEGAAIDWPAVQIGATTEDRRLLEELRLLCTVADLHRRLSIPVDEPSTARGGESAQYWGRLRLIERIGGGSFGEVHRAWDPRLHREVALKLIHTPEGSSDRRLASILGEGRLLARVRHPGVVTIYDAEQIDTRVGLSMEFVEGPTLEQRLKQNGPFPANETVEIAVQLCDALSAAHLAGVLHRDIKAANVVIKEDGRIVLMDFGAGRQLDDAVSTALTGTPLYVAPEVLRGHEATVRSDVYSVGVLLHYMLSGSYPVQAGSLPELRLAHARRLAGQWSSDLASRMAIPAGLVAVIERATHPLPEHRPEDAAALAADLRRLQGGSRAYGRGLVLGAAALIVVMLGAAVILVGRGSHWFPAGTDGAVAASLAPVRIAVLPFALAGDEPDGDLLQEGLIKDLIARLQTYDNARVISTASAFSIDTRNIPLKEIGARLDVSEIVAVRVVRSGDTVVGSARLVGLPDERTIWWREYTRPVAELLDLHRSIALELAEQLQLQRAGGIPGRPPRYLEAYTLYVRGRTALDRFTPDGNLLALRLFEQALAMDPDYPQVHAGLAQVYLQMNPAVPGLTGEEALRRASEAAARALSLDRSLPEAHVAGAIVKSAAADWSGAEQEYRRAIELSPSNVVAREEYARWLSLLGRFDEALGHARVAESLDPLSPRAIISVALVLRFARRYEEAIPQARKALEIDPGHLGAYSSLGHSYQGMGRFDEAIESFLRMGRPSGNLGNAYAQAGRTGEARAVLVQLEQRYEQSGLGAREIAQIYTGLGEVDRAFAWLDRVDRLHTGWPTTFRVAPVWDPLRSDPRFSVLLAKYGLAN